MGGAPGKGGVIFDISTVRGKRKTRVAEHENRTKEKTKKRGGGTL